MSSIARPVARSVSRSVLAGQGVDLGYLIRSMFSSGEQGFFYDPNDLSTMYQDAAGTVPVTAVGQPVGLILDKSGRGNHARQTTSASRPILQKDAITGAYYLAFDGSDDFLVTSSINFTATDKISLFAGVRKLSDASIGSVFGLSSAPISASGVFEMYAPQTVGGEGVAYYSRGASTRSVVLTQGLKASVGFILSAQTDIANNTVICKINQSLTAVAGGNLGGGSFSNNPLFIGRRAGTSLPFNGHLYSLIGVARLSTDAETKAIEKELAKRTGVTLS